MIKVTDLMIGDWVLTFESTYKEKVYAQIWAIEEGQTSILVKKDKCDWFVDIEWIEPIPLTPEILEKNGFRDVSTHTLKGAETFGLRLGDYKLTYKLNDYFALDSFDDRWYRLFETQFCHKWCVHQLQHALKLCGIDKEITL